MAMVVEVRINKDTIRTIVIQRITGSSEYESMNIYNVVMKNHETDEMVLLGVVRHQYGLGWSALLDVAMELVKDEEVRK